MALSVALPFSRGEDEMHRLLHVPDRENPTSSMLSPFAAYQLPHAPLLAVGTVDDHGRPWTSVWGGESGFAQPFGGSVVALHTKVESMFDPVVRVLMKSKDDGQVVEEDVGARMVGALAIDLEKRSRVKLFGHMLAGSLSRANKNDIAVDTGADLQLAVKIEQSIGNCPKYLNRKTITAAQPNPKLLSRGSTLSPESIALIGKADLFFMSTSNASLDMDTNHRGGPSGFVRVLSNDESGAEIVYPEYSGNRLYQSLGNLRITPLAGIVFPDFESGDVLYLTGSAEILIGPDANEVLPRTNLAVKIKIIEARFVEKGLPFRGAPGEPSPYNPSVRVLAKEGALSSQMSGSTCTATLASKNQITPTVNRYRFSLNKSHPFEAGQWVALDFSNELDMGYSHMRDEDPQSLNDDFIRTFTVSRWLAKPVGQGPTEFEITVRKHGSVTAFLSSRATRLGLEVGMRGFGGDFRIKTEMASIGFVAGGVGITPLLGQASELDLKRIQLIWTLPLDDMPLVLDTIEQFPDLAHSARIFFTDSKRHLNETEEEGVQRLLDVGVRVEHRRLVQTDLSLVAIEKWYICASVGLRKTLLQWLEGRPVDFEDFSY